MRLTAPCAPSWSSEAPPMKRNSSATKGSEGSSTSQASMPPGEVTSSISISAQAGMAARRTPSTSADVRSMVVITDPPRSRVRRWWRRPPRRPLAWAAARAPRPAAS